MENNIKNYKEENIEGSFYEQELQKSSQEVFKIDKVLKKDTKKKLAFVKWKDSDERFNSWVKLSELKKLKNTIRNLFSITIIYEILKQSFNHCSS